MDISQSMDIGCSLISFLHSYNSICIAFYFKVETVSTVAVAPQISQLTILDARDTASAISTPQTLPELMMSQLSLHPELLCIDLYMQNRVVCSLNYFWTLHPLKSGTPPGSNKAGL